MRNRATYWGYICHVLNEYPTLKAQKNLTKVQKRKVKAVDSALNKTNVLDNAEVTRTLIDLVYFRRTHNLVGAALLCYVSERTAQRLQRKFIKCVAVELELDE